MVLRAGRARPRAPGTVSASMVVVEMCGRRWRDAEGSGLWRSWSHNILSEMTFHCTSTFAHHRGHHRRGNNLLTPPKNTKTYNKKKRQHPFGVRCCQPRKQPSHGIPCPSSGRPHQEPSRVVGKRTRCRTTINGHAWVMDVGHCRSTAQESRWLLRFTRKKTPSEALSIRICRTFESLVPSRVQS